MFSTRSFRGVASVATSLAVLILLASALDPSVVDVTVKVNSTVAVATTSPAFLGVNIDAASLYQGHRLDLTDPTLRTLARTLATEAEAGGSAMVLRVGGSAADALGWGPNTTQQIRLDPAYWDQLVDFASYAGFRLAFDLNAMSMRLADGTWNTTDAEALLTRTRQRHQPLWAVQLGNEPGHYRTRHPLQGPTAEQHGRDFIRLRELLETAYANASHLRPRIQGPDICGGAMTDTSPCANNTYLATVLRVAGSAIDDVTVHRYALAGPKKGRPDECFTAAMVSPSFWEEGMLVALREWKALQQAVAPGSRLVLSESATAGDGGCPGKSNSFASGFFVMEELAAVTRIGYWQAYRQDLVGFSGVTTNSSYALVGGPGWYSAEATGPLTPNPDFFTSRLWARLVGEAALAATTSLPPTSQVRAHVSCATGGGAVLTYANPSAATLNITVVAAMVHGAPARQGGEGGGDGAAPLEMYILTAPGNNLTSRTILLNGDPTPLQGTDPLRPRLLNTSTSIQTVALPPHSYGFVVDRNARFAACPTATLPTTNRASKAEGTGPLGASPTAGACLDPRDFGAVAGNPGGDAGPNWQRNTAAIQAAIDLAGNTSSASDCVSIQGGDFVSAGLRLRSHTVFRVEADARVLQAINKTNHSLVSATSVTNVTVAGSGVLYGNAEHYISYYSPEDDRFQPCAPDGGRPRLLTIENSTAVVVRDIHLQNTTDWNLHIVSSHDVLVDHVDIYGDWRFPNNDGIDPDSSTDVRITNCNINVADDGICPKSTTGSGPLRDLYVANCTIRSKSHAIKFGSNTDTEMSNVAFENITIWDSNSGIAMQNRGAGDVHNVTFRDLRVETRYVAPRWWGNGEWLSITSQPRNPGDSIGRCYDILLDGITARSENGGLVSGRAHGVQNITLRNVHVTIDRFGNYSNGSGPPCCIGALALWLVPSLRAATSPLCCWTLA